MVDMVNFGGKQNQGFASGESIFGRTQTKVSLIPQSSKHTASVLFQCIPCAQNYNFCAVSKLMYYFLLLCRHYKIVYSTLFLSWLCAQECWPRLCQKLSVGFFFYLFCAQLLLRSTHNYQASHLSVQWLNKN